MLKANKSNILSSLLTAIILLDPTAVFAEPLANPANNSGAIAKDPLLEQTVSGTLWLKSGEGRALAYQAFNLARMMFDKAVAENVKKEKLAVIVDIDDTIIDTTGYIAGLILGRGGSGEEWEKWVRADEAKPLSGAVEFLNDVVEKGGDVYYVTNRFWDLKEATLKNLSDLGFPQAVNEHLYVREQGMGASKESRRAEVAKNHRIVLLMGDNLGDFSDLFAPVSVKARGDAVDKVKDLFGTKFIVLPNPMYGDWEKAILENRNDLTVEQMLEMRKKALSGKK